MFTNIGKKIKHLAFVITVVGMLASLILGIFFTAEGDAAIGLPILFGGVLVSWVGSFLLYGFGELVDNSAEIKNDIKNITHLNILKSTSLEKEEREEIEREIKRSVIEEMQRKRYEEKIEENPDYDPENIAHKDECPMCFHRISPNDKECSYCGHKLK